MKKNRGVTLISLIIYIILTIMVLGMLTVLVTHFKENLNDISETTNPIVEFDKLNLQLLKETKLEGNTIDEKEKTKIVFRNGNTYTYVPKDRTVYLNENIKVAEDIAAFNFEVKKENNRQQLDVTVKIDENTRTTKYLIERANYTVLEYIESTGTQYIDTDVPAKSGLKADMKLMVVDNSANSSVLGTITSTGRIYLLYLLSTGKFGIGYGEVYGRGTLETDTIYNVATELTVGSQSMEVNTNKIYSSNLTNNIDLGLDLYMFALNNNMKPANYASIKLYSCKIYQDDILIRDFIPVLNSQGVACLYDLVEEKYYYNVGTGTFEYPK